MYRKNQDYIERERQQKPYLLKDWNKPSMSVLWRVLDYPTYLEVNCRSLSHPSASYGNMISRSSSSRYSPT